MHLVRRYKNRKAVHVFDMNIERKMNWRSTELGGISQLCKRARRVTMTNLILPVYLLMLLVSAQSPQPKVNSITYTGNGCPPGKFSYLLSPISVNSNPPSANLTTVFGASMNPLIGPGININETKKICVLTLALVIEDGWKVQVNGKGTGADIYAKLTGKDIKLEGRFRYGFQSGNTEVRHLPLLW